MPPYADLTASIARQRDHGFAKVRGALRPLSDRSEKLAEA